MRGLKDLNRNEITLRYGVNPHQQPARITWDTKEAPLKVESGKPGYINFMDALNSWQLVRELKASLGMPCAASFKHVSPAGAAIGKPLSADLKKAYGVLKLDLSPLACAYLRARGADRLSSFGDWIALSDEVDVPTAKVISREVSDGVIAPSYEPRALEILRAKRGGNYNVIKIDPSYEPEEQESRQIFGITFEQKRNTPILDADLLKNVVTANKEIPENAKQDLTLANITLKYTQSNSVCFAFDGQVIGCGAGQQSRIHCTRLAGMKADTWWLRQHPRVLSLRFKKGLSRPEKDNAIDGFLRDDLTLSEQKFWEASFDTIPQRLAKDEKIRWLSTLQGVSLASDAFFPFRDNVDRAAQSGVKYISQPGGSKNDDLVVAACDEYGIAMAFTKVRLFHH